MDEIKAAVLARKRTSDELSSLLGAAGCIGGHLATLPDTLDQRLARPEHSALCLNQYRLKPDRRFRIGTTNSAIERCSGTYYILHRETHTTRKSCLFSHDHAQKHAERYRRLAAWCEFFGSLWNDARDSYQVRPRRDRGASGAIRRDFGIGRG